MSDPITNVEIEDVLASIRRLVSTGDQTQRPGAQKREPQQGERLVLTPALRVTDPPKTEPANTHIAPWGPFSTSDDEAGEAAQKTSEDRSAETAQQSAETPPKPESEAADEPAELTVTADDLAAADGDATTPIDAPEVRSDSANEDKPVDADDEEAVGALLTNVMSAVQSTNAYASFGPIAATVALAERRSADAPNAAEDAAPSPDAQAEPDAAEASDQSVTAENLDTDLATDDAPENAGTDPVEADLQNTPTFDAAQETAEPTDAPETGLAEPGDAATADSAAEDSTAAAPEETSATPLAAAGAFAAGSAASRAPDIASTVRKSIEEAIAELEARADAEDDTFEPDGSEPPLLPRVDEEQSLHDIVTSADDSAEEVLSWDDELADTAPAEPEPQAEAPSDVPEPEAMAAPSETDQVQALSEDDETPGADSLPSDPLSAEDATDHVAAPDADIVEAPATSIAHDPAPAETADLMPEPVESDESTEDLEDLAALDGLAPEEVEQASTDSALSTEPDEAAEADTATAALYPTASEDEDTTADPEDSPAEATAPQPVPRSPFGRIPQMARAAFAKATGTAAQQSAAEELTKAAPAQGTADEMPSVSDPDLGTEATDLAHMTEDTPAEIGFAEATQADVPAADAALEPQTVEDVGAPASPVAEEDTTEANLLDTAPTEEPADREATAEEQHDITETPVAEIVAETHPTDDSASSDDFVSNDSAETTDAAAPLAEDTDPLAEAAPDDRPEIQELPASETVAEDSDIVDADVRADMAEPQTEAPSADAADAPIPADEAIDAFIDAEAVDVTEDAAPEPEISPEPDLPADPEADPEPALAEAEAADPEPALAEAAEAEADMPVMEADASGSAAQPEPAEPPIDTTLDTEPAPTQHPPAEETPAETPAEAGSEPTPTDSGADIHQFATVRGIPERGNQIAASPDLDDDSTIAALYEQDNYLDEEALRDLVGDIVREELQGVLGERITRNVRKLVRREIHRILNSQDFD